jgi:hypothetical protein
VFAVVEHQHPGQCFGVGQQSVDRIGPRFNPDRGANRLGDEAALPQRCQFGEPHHLASPGGAPRQLHRQPSLAAPPGPSEGDQPFVLDQLDERFKIRATANEPGHRQG